MRPIVVFIQTFVTSFLRTGKSKSTMNHQLMYAYTNPSR